MRTDWRAIVGPALTAAMSLLVIAADRAAGGLPDPAPVQVCLVAMAAALAGIGPGLISAVIAVAASALLQRHGAGGPIHQLEAMQLGLLTATAAVTAVVTGLLRQKMVSAITWERDRHATATRLAAALDEIDIGVVLLDADTRAQFINRAFRKYFALPDAKADSKPPFIALMYHGRDAGCYELPRDELAHFIAERTEKMRAGDSTPVKIKMADGQVMRFHCTALPDGGRMLSYTPVTDLVRRTDDPAMADYFRSLRGADVFAPGRLNAAE